MWKVWLKPNETYNEIFAIFTKLYNKNFSIRKLKVKSKRVLTHLIANGIAKSSKRKQKLSEKLLKNLISTNQTLKKFFLKSWNNNLRKKIYSEELIRL